MTNIKEITCLGIFFLFLILSQTYSVCHSSELFTGAWKNIKENIQGIEGLEDLAVGAGALIATKPYTDVDEEVSAVPIIVGRYKHFYVDGTSLGYILHEGGESGLEFSMVGKPRFMGYDSDDGAGLTGMEDREWSLDGGLRMVWAHDLFEVSLTGLADLLGHHEGQEVSAVISKKFFEGSLTPRIGVKWQSADMIDYYYGVRSNEVRSGRASYLGDDTVNWVAGVTIAVPMGEAWAFTVDFEYEGLGDEIEDSPIVNDHEVLTHVVGIVYRF